MNATELTWGIVGLAAGLALAMLALWLLLVLDGRRLRRMRRHRSLQAAAVVREPAVAEEKAAPTVLAVATPELVAPSELPAPAEAGETASVEKLEPPVSLETVFAEAAPKEPETSPKEWRPAEPRSRQAPE